MKRLKADFHIHTAEDPEDLIYYDARQLIDMAREEGYSVLAITNHNRCTWSPYLRDYAKERGICLLPGMEASIEGRHVVLINFDFSRLSLGSIRDLQQLKDQPDGLIMAPHPFYPSPVALRDKLLKNLDLFHAIEWCHFYSRGINRFNIKASSVAKEHGKVLLGTSDAHQRRQFGTTYSLIDAEPEPEAVIAAVKMGLAEVVTRPLTMTDLLRINLTMTLRNQVIRRLNLSRNGSVHHPLHHS